MEQPAKTFRESRLNLLQFYSSPEDQVEWQERMPTLGIDEPLEWWLEDFFPESKLFKAAFSHKEIETLEQFHAILSDASLNWPRPPYPRVEAALKDPAWMKVVETARKVLEAVK